MCCPCAASLQIVAGLPRSSRFENPKFQRDENTGGQTLLRILDLAVQRVHFQVGQQMASTGLGTNYCEGSTLFHAIHEAPACRNFIWWDEQADVSGTRRDRRP